jgi:hypothetical protein
VKEARVAPRLSSPRYKMPINSIVWLGHDATYDPAKTVTRDTPRFDSVTVQ